MSDTAGGTPQWDAPLGQRPRGLSPTVTAFAQGVLWLVATVALLAAVVVGWMAQASTAAAERQPPGRRWAGPWPIVGWLIPLASFVLPRLAMGEIERIATTATGTDGRVQPDWRLTRPSSTGRLWWACWVAAPIALAYGDPVERLWAKATAYPGRQYWAYALLGAAMLLWSISAAAGAMTVRRIGRHLAR